MTALSGWKQLVVALAIAGVLVVIIRLAGVPGACDGGGMTDHALPTPRPAWRTAAVRLVTFARTEYGLFSLDGPRGRRS